jgi:hypothetical protein
MQTTAKNILSKVHKALPIVKINAHVTSPGVPNIANISFISFRLFEKPGCCSSKYIEISCGICNIKLTYKCNFDNDFNAEFMKSHDHNTAEQPALLLSENKDYRTLKSLAEWYSYRGHIYCGFCKNAIVKYCKIPKHLEGYNIMYIVQYFADLLNEHLNSVCCCVYREKRRFEAEYEKRGWDCRKIISDEITEMIKTTKKENNESIEAEFTGYNSIRNLIRLDDCICGDSKIAMCKLCHVTRTVFDGRNLKSFYSSCVKNHFGKSTITFSHKDFILTTGRKLVDYEDYWADSEDEDRPITKFFSYSLNGYLCAICGIEYESYGTGAFAHVHDYPPMELVLLHFSECAAKNSSEYINSGLLCT